MIVRPRPIAETGDTITYSRTDVDRLFEQLEDLEARAAYAAARGEERLPAEVVERICAGVSPVTVFREHRGLSAALLAEKSGIAVSYLAGIESGGRRASAKALSALAAVLEVSVEDLRS
jgi:ribosome-binding protein aMBF1 (putative translation factor)